ncbi:hypothetical protein [Mycoplasma struthionis]|uniref:DUF4190 domain-containing protein n=1 Tax=Mycoplasma struthionis TaxID=538220 RepID=A0A3G8LGN1_9MOLU|nr:hypothetical protein [Mycoplasma struthionis]AZG68843.1 hypothetical protein EGN60_02680 [Mycoplasma struthionis]TPI01507.1 hypothetical protein FJM01_02565 [Mycoplasma struthionis]
MEKQKQRDDLDLMAILALIFSFFVPIAGLVLGSIALNKNKKIKSKESIVMSKWAIVISVFFIIISIIVMALVTKFTIDFIEYKNTHSAPTM